MLIVGSYQGEGPYLCARGWDAGQGRAYEVYEYKKLGEIGSQPVTPLGRGSLVEITAENDNGVSRWKFRFETVQGVQGGSAANAKRVRGFTAETPIYKHKDFKWIYAWYGLWIDRGRVTWKSYFPGKPKLEKKTIGGKEMVVFKSAPIADFTGKSPLSGVQVFHEARIEVEKTSLIRGRGVTASDLGKISRPTNVVAGKRKKWIKSGIKISPRGDGYIVSEYWLQNNMDKKRFWPIDYDGPVDQGDNDEGEEE